VAVQGRGEHPLELADRKRLDEIGRGREQLCLGARRVDADADDRQLRARLAEASCELEGAGVAGLDQHQVRAGCIVGLDDCLPAGTLHNPHQKLTHLRIRLADRHARHGVIVGGAKENRGGVRYEGGMKAARILVVDDDSDIRTLVRALLERAGHEVADAPDGREGLRSFHSWRPDLVLLDVHMPALDGWQTLERIRDLSDVPVLMLTAAGSELEKVRGLKAGADDYVTKPFGRQELLARVEALLRRRGDVRTELPAPYEDSLLRVDFAGRRVEVEGREVTLTPLEFRLLGVLVRHPNQTLSHEQLLELVWGTPDGSRDQVKLYVGYVRRKLGAPDAIESVRGFGYRYRPPD
jgi:DNA-binding response OmpR family regulator